MSKLDTLTSWHSKWSDLRVVIYGLGVSGFSAADTLAELGCKVLVVATKSEPEYIDLLEVLGVETFISASKPETLAKIQAFDPEVVVTSPGFRPDSDEIVWANDAGITIWTDIDLAWRLRDKLGKPADWICVTGTNGKTTTVQLTTHILQTAGLRAVSCGNIGTPILDCVRDETGFDVLVVELSSFQLHYLGEIAPFASAVLNVDLDHLDWHGSLNAYRSAKGKIFEKVESACVYNTTDEQTMKLVESADVQDGARAIGFGIGFPGPANFGFVEDVLVDNAYSPMRKSKVIEALATLEQISNIGVVTKHLLQNIAAAAALTRAYGVPAKAIGDGISTFKLDGHRIELVLERDGIAWIDDSKATNPHAAAASLNSFDSVIWLVGGLLKGVDISALVKTVASKIKAAVVIGVDRSMVLAALAEHAPTVPVIEIGDGEDVMGRAVAAAGGIAATGDTVLLAPASASMDQFKDYADRGNQFSRAVLKQNGVGDG
ncbi:MAG: UDP-N-acetylmuramoylalanine--D-glutamate ligase [Actinomycetota bacterium]|jgi:UDP-N-acetylmuramoylalanine--D-glutamate ligase